MAEEMGPMKANTRPMNTSEVRPTIRRMEEYTSFGSSPSLFAKRKKVVSIP